MQEAARGGGLLFKTGERPGGVGGWGRPFNYPQRYGRTDQRQFSIW
jgi:hypothetical protein